MSDELVSRSTSEVTVPHRDGRLPFVQLVARTASKVDAQPQAGLGMSIGEALQRGELLRVVGPQDALASGAQFQRSATESGTVLRGTLVDPSSKRIVAQAELTPSDVSQATAMLGAFQLASFATGQYYLHTITQQLSAVQESIDGLTAYLEMEADAELDAADTTMEELGRVIGSTGNFEHRDWDRLNTSEETASRRYFHALRSCQRIADHWHLVADQLADALVRSGSAHPARVKRLKSELGELGREADEVAAYLDRLVRASKLLVRARLLRALGEISADDERGEVFRREVEHTFCDRSKELGALVSDLLALKGPTSQDISRLFAFDGKPSRGLESYREQLVPLAEAVGTIPDLLVELAKRDLVILDARGETGSRALIPAR